MNFFRGEFRATPAINAEFLPHKQRDIEEETFQLFPEETGQIVCIPHIGQAVIPHRHSDPLMERCRDHRRSIIMARMHVHATQLQFP